MVRARKNRDILVYQRVLVLGVDSHAKGYLDIFPPKKISQNFGAFVVRMGDSLRFLLNFQLFLVWS